ncbi:hypothetical protein BX600DRAFT_511720 [Xylariales sp. PMI_506]|nr:hypothetical protein BX600DRAFT_511720 [Xylariales sp. PMI_506]
MTSDSRHWSSQSPSGRSSYSQLDNSEATTLNIPDATAHTEPWDPIAQQPGTLNNVGEALSSWDAPVSHTSNQDYPRSSRSRTPPAGFQSSRSRAAGRPRPEPFQFEDNVGYLSAAASSRDAYSPRGLGSKRVDSSVRLLNTPTNSDWARTPHTPPPYTMGLPPRKKWWHWRPAWVMYLSLVFGLCCALGHHLFYASLNNKEATNQLAMLRYGTLLSFGAKAGFVAAGVTAYRQRVWTTVRTKLISVGALDSLFAATDDMFALLNTEIYQRAKVAVFLAILVWLTPLVIIFTSNTLQVKLAQSTVPGQCPGIRTLNFTGEADENWRDPTVIDGLYGTSVNLWNATMSDPSNQYYFDYWTETSPQFKAVAQLGILSMQPMQPKGAGLSICGSGWNCSYTVNFTAPGYKCTELANGIDSSVQNLGENIPPFNTSILLPEGNYSYYASTDLGDYSSTQLQDVGLGGMPNSAPPFPADLGAFRTEPIVWVGYSELADGSQTPPTDRTQSNWNQAYIPKIFACENYMTAYTVKFIFAGQDATVNITQREYLSPVVNTTYLPGVNADDGTSDNITATPQSNYVYANVSVPTYRLVASYHSIGAVLRDAIKGAIDSTIVTRPLADTNALQTKLLNPRAYWMPYANLQEQVQSLYEDIVLSIFYNPTMVSVVWAAKPSELSGDLEGDDTTMYPCVRSRYVNLYNYIARDLWIVYGCAFLCAAVSVALGTAAVLANEGRLYDTRFSSIVASTRGPALEKVAWHKEDGGGLAPDIKSLRVGYGIIHPAGGPAGGGGIGAPAAATPSVTDPQQIHELDGSNGMADSTSSLGGVGGIRYGFGLEGDVRQS